MILRPEMAEIHPPKLYSLTLEGTGDLLTVVVRFSLRAWTLVEAHMVARDIPLPTVTRGEGSVDLRIPCRKFADGFTALHVATDVLTWADLAPWEGEESEQLVWIDGFPLDGARDVRVVLTQRVTAFLRQAPRDVLERVSRVIQRTFTLMFCSGQTSQFGLFVEHGLVRMKVGHDCGCLGAAHYQTTSPSLVLDSHNLLMVGQRWLVLGALAAIEDEYRRWPTH